MRLDDACEIGQHGHDLQFGGKFLCFPDFCIYLP